MQASKWHSANNQYLLCCTTTIFLSAFLFFLVQPLAAKAILPFFGGAPAVWNTCMMFFQGVLLLSYLYVYLCTRVLFGKSRLLVHFVVVSSSLLMLPLSFVGKVPDIGTYPVWTVIWLLTQTLLLPVFILGTTSSLVQYWFSHSTHSQAKDPYFLYSASNIGSLLALISFPFLLEPKFGLQQLSWVWSVSYFVYILMLFLSKRDVGAVPTVIENKQLSPGTNQRLKWLLLSFAPCSLLIAVTQYITTDIASVPLLWILPLLLYLLAYIIAFSRKPWISQAWILRELPLFLIFPLISLSIQAYGMPAWQIILFHMLGFFALTMVCVSELVASRPSVSYLTEYYLWIALGGFLGSVFNSVIAPLLFNDVYEYYIAFCLCVCLQPWGLRQSEKKNRFPDYALPIIVTSLLLAGYLLDPLTVSYSQWINYFIILSTITLILTWWRHPTHVATSIGILFLFATQMSSLVHGDLIWKTRNFFGVARVYNKDELKQHRLVSGTTLHGLQSTKEPFDPNQALSYYKPMKELAQVFHQRKKSLHVAIAGLGAGTLSCQFSGDFLRYYEIDPTVVSIATTPALFSFLTHCPPRLGISLGDARINIAKAPENYYELIIIDVYNSDAIPIHLFTYEAVKIYLNKLSPQGVIAFHISSRHMNLSPVLAGNAQQVNMGFLYLVDTPSLKQAELQSIWVILTNNAALTNELVTKNKWKKVNLLTKRKVFWTDDYSNILSVLL